MRAFLCAAMLALCAPAWGAVVTGYFEGTVYGNLNLWHKGMPPEADPFEVVDLASADGRVSFTYDTAKAPAPVCEADVSVLRCAYAASLDWLQMSFEFAGGYSGFATSADPTNGGGVIIESGSSNSMQVFMTGAWMTSAGGAEEPDSMGGGLMFNSPAMSYALPTALDATGTPWGQTFWKLFGSTPAIDWTAELVFDPETLRVSVVPIPSTLALLAPLVYLTARTARSARRATPASRRK